MAQRQPNSDRVRCDCISAHGTCEVKCGNSLPRCSLHMPSGFRNLVQTRIGGPSEPLRPEQPAYFTLVLLRHPAQFGLPRCVVAKRTRMRKASTQEPSFVLFVDHETKLNLGCGKGCGTLPLLAHHPLVYQLPWENAAGASGTEVTLNTLRSGGMPGDTHGVNP
jgi:hypothetical protein